MEVRKLGSGDGLDAFAVMSAPEVLRELATMPPGADAAWMGRYLGECSRLPGAAGVWGAFQQAEGLVAVVSLLPLRAGGLFLGYLVHPAHWGRGIATEAAARVLLEAAERHPGARVATSVEEDSPASARVLEKLGFQRDGIRTYMGRSRSGAAEGPHFTLTLDGPLAELRAAAAGQPSRAIPTR